MVAMVRHVVIVTNVFMVKKVTMVKIVAMVRHAAIVTNVVMVKR
jgi:hypothetical protein